MRERRHADRRHDDRRDHRRRQRRRRREDEGHGAVTLLAAGFLGGLVVGAAAWAGMLDRSRQGLFSRQPVRRFAAVSYLATRPSVDTARLLRDYVRWEPHPLLRRRGRQALAAVEASLAR
ncbi:hypothetical protein [Roseisolibacter sp. H3M3-2]|uniref:hypothetical protein n=1 Tax=Roseisolibacter sp. H3M3-2 TaxID=3031323 RepID=UPI0023D987A9|nr:hypothetical protein [Roseisolibacter sp. H3M3-2]MDF1505645.1 hypothetical protein [Roseisolibacter sp. H3M3-2]